MKFLVNLLAPAAVFIAAAGNASAQDLGSANKLFGTAAKPATSAEKKHVARPRPAIRKATTAKKNKAPAKASTATAKTSDKEQLKKGASENTREHRSNTAAKVTGRAADHTASAASQDKGRSASKAEVSPVKPTEAKLSAADEARYEQLIEQANAARDERDYSKAESIYKTARSLKARDARAIYGLGNIYSDQQRWEEAENSYRAALQLEPSSAMTHVALSYVLTQPLSVSDLSARYSEAEKLARRASELSPRTALAFDQLGVALEMRGEIGSDTENSYRRAIQLDPTFAPAYAHLGRLLRRRGLIDQSKEAYRQAIERSTDVGTMVLVAEVLQSEQRFADSVPLLKEALDADPRNPSALLMLGHALTVTQDFRTAEDLLRRAASVSSNGYMANSLLASLYMRQGAYELAENALLQAIRSAPAYENRQLAQAFVSVGQGYTKAGKTQQAQRAYAQASKLDPESGVYSGRFKP